MAEQDYFEWVEGPDQTWEPVFDVSGADYNTFSQSIFMRIEDLGFPTETLTTVAALGDAFERVHG